MKCETCQFWVKREWQRIGGCHRYGPSLMPRLVIPGAYQSEHDMAGSWPTTDRDDFCGDYLPKPEPEPDEAQKDQR